MTDDEGWEARMSARAKAREKVAREDPKQQARDEYQRRCTDLPWLNGWRRTSLTEVAIGHPHCIGCGRFLAVVCLIIEEGWEPPPIPKWPFTPDACPVCLCRAYIWDSSPLGHSSSYPRTEMREVTDDD